MPQNVVLSWLVDGKNEDLGRVVHIEECRKEQKSENQKKNSNNRESGGLRIEGEE